MSCMSKSSSRRRSRSIAQQSVCSNNSETQAISFASKVQSKPESGSCTPSQRESGSSRQLESNGCSSRRSQLLESNGRSSASSGPGEGSECDNPSMTKTQSQMSSATTCPDDDANDNNGSCQSHPHRAYDQCTVLSELPGISLQGDFSRSGMKPPKIAGALSACYNSFAKYAPCGHWSTCKQSGCKDKKCFDPCSCCATETPYGPYGPWTKHGPAKFVSPKADYIRCIYPIKKRKPACLPMGKLAPWPLSGSCRYAGRPYGPCRPFGAYKSRGPFGVWTCKGWSTCIRPMTPCQPSWDRTTRGCRPCTPCHRPLFRPLRRFIVS